MNAFLSTDPEIGDKIELVPLADTTITKNFIVTVKDTGEILHTTKAGQACGEGKATTTAERLLIVDKIKDILDL